MATVLQIHAVWFQGLFLMIALVCLYPLLLNTGTFILRSMHGN
jgi:hypothetical protein